jgi:hypothetical protein
MKIKNVHILFNTHFKVVLWYEHIMCIKQISLQHSHKARTTFFRFFFYEGERLCSEDNCGLFNKCLHLGNEPTTPPLHATFKTVTFGKINCSHNVYTSFLHTNLVWNIFHFDEYSEIRQRCTRTHIHTHRPSCEVIANTVRSKRTVRRIANLLYEVL